VTGHRTTKSRGYRPVAAHAEIIIAAEIDGLAFHAAALPGEYRKTPGILPDRQKPTVISGGTQRGQLLFDGSMYILHRYDG
jgi:hypothetical protein